MNIVYSHHTFTAQALGGIARYYAELVRGVAAIRPVKVLAGPYVSAYVDKFDGLVGCRLPNIKYTGWIRNGIGSILDRAYIFSNPKSLFHMTYYDKPLRPKKGALVATIFDLIHERFPQDIMPGDRSSLNKMRLAHEADEIIAISQSTKDDLVQYGVEGKKIHVIYLGNSFLNYPQTVLTTKQSEGSVSQPFLLFVGDRWGYKNFRYFIQAYAHSELLKKQFRVVCFGKPFSDNEHSFFDKLGVRSLVEIRSGSDQVLVDLYRRAFAFIYPSKWEGFGLPILEAMTFGCPVVLSGLGSMKEVAGDAGIYVHVDQEDFDLQLEKVLSDSELLKMSRARGIERSKLFTWEETVRKHLDLYSRLDRVF